ncbi:MAG: glutamate-5-semialdehyde dehydrogenase [Clostridium sp.]|nr:glutamate-5-semialdehyde dehydrogenase [Clostridium sp.]
MVTTLETTAQNAKLASYTLASLDTTTKNNALEAIAKKLEENKLSILQENAKDLEAAKTLLENGEITKSTFNRLKLDENKMRDMIQGIRDVKRLEDPVNKKLWAMGMDTGLDLYRVSCPIGVIGVIFEARPDVIPQICSLAVKSANAVLLKGGKEAQNTNIILTKLIKEALSEIPQFPENTINLLFTRNDVSEMLTLDKYIDLIIPRGGNSLVSYVKNNTKIPVMGHADGICHIYIDEQADLKKATEICIDAKTQYPSACNAVETILIHESLLENYLPQLVIEFEKAGVTVKGDAKCKEFVPHLELASKEDWATEYGDLTVSIKAVKDLFDAVAHINVYGSGHTDCIISEDKQSIEVFMNLVDSAGVFANASTRFADGFRYGLGAEVGISTAKTHARGPVGLEGLTIYKYKLYGKGQTVAPYADGKKTFIHQRII